jgi:hypothetical protein
MLMQPGPFLAEHLGGVWHPLDNDPAAIAGHLELAGVFCYLGMGFEESGGDWLQIAYLYARPAIDANSDDRSACGRGVGSRVITGLRAWTEQTRVPHRFVAIENPAFFGRFDGWDDAQLDADSDDGECWYYPRSPV